MKRDVGTKAAGTTYRRTGWKRWLLGLTASLVLVTLMLTGLASAVTPVAPLIQPTPQGHYTPNGQPDPTVHANVTQATLNDSCGVFCWSSVSGQATTYVVAPSGLELDPYVPNAIRYVDLTHIVAPGTLQSVALPGSVAGCTGSTHTCEDPLHGANWVNENVTNPTYAPCHGGTACFQTLVAPTVSNVTDSYSTYGGKTGLKVLQIVMNDSAKRPNKNAVVLDLSLGQLSLPSLNPANDYFTVIYSLSYSGGSCASASSVCRAAIGVSNASGMSTAPTSFLWWNATTQQPLPAYNALRTASKDGKTAAWNYSLDNLTSQRSFNSTQYLDYNYSTASTWVFPGEVAMWSAPLSDFGAGWGAYKAPGVNLTAGCSTDGGTNCTTAVNFTAFMETAASGVSTAATNLTLTVWGLSVTSAPVSLGPSFQSVHIYKPTKASGKNFGSWANVTQRMAVSSEFGGPTAYTSWSPSWTGSGWVNNSGLQEAIAYPATSLTNVTQSVLTSANGSGQISYQFRFSLPTPSSWAYSSCVQVTDQKQQGTYTTVTATSSDGTTGYNDAPSLAKAGMAVGNVTVIAPLTSSLAADCTPAAPPTSGVHSSVMPLVAALQPGNVVVNETLSYSASVICQITTSCTPPPCAETNTCPTNSTAGSVSFTSQLENDIVTWWWLEFAGAVVIIAVVLYERKGHRRSNR